ncbi:MAG: lytic polysaccharide monooxygenase [Moritella sp.]|uniref:lytic polysaccharide monooxygenase n=1 Tax=Moritella sp. TaxID=78556 RepID=UPI00299FFF94|nr:lytic polysaccharide monooxygenase [Moritella sp.]MDX2319027.1 lytic polysaccharide monooxygenase [Moritella sp.]
MLRKTVLTIASLSVYSVLFSGQALAHGWSEYPEARQKICYDQGGIWSGTPPNAACAQAKDISGSYPFVQHNEFSINVSDYNNIQAVKNAIPDGTLCYANDPQKKGMGAAHSGWTRSDVQAGTFEYVFKATALHNPSFWEFYLTKPNADLSKPLAWGDLELIQEEGNVVAEGGKYRINVTIPTDRVGDATLLVRWQRIDSAGEGFYNCSDITIVNDEVIPPPVIPDPDPIPPYLQEGSAFIPESIRLDSASVGDSVNYKVLNKDGVEHSSFSLVVTEDNKNDWDRLLASKVNGWYESKYNGNVFIGRWHEEMNHYMYFKNDLHGNYFNSKDARASGQFSITTDDLSIEAVISPKVLKNLDKASVKHGDYVVLTQAESKGDVTNVQWLQTSGTPINMVIGSNNELIIKTAELANTRQELTFKLVLSGDNATDEEVYSFVVEPTGTTGPDGPTDPVEPTDPDEPVGNAWSGNQTYTANDVVSYGNKIWTAQWWTTGEEPGTTGQWGVWR